MRQTLYLLVLAPLLLMGCVKDSDDATSSGDDQNSSSNQTTPSQKELFFCETKDLDSGSRNQIANMFTAQRNSIAASANASSAKTTSFPVYFHVIGRDRSEASREVPDEALVEQIDVLNRAFSGKTGGAATPYRFKLGGINHVNRPEWRTISPGSKQETAMKKTLRVGGVTTLNVYITDIVPPPNQNVKGKILGFATFPFTYRMQPTMDGVVLNYRTVPGSDVANYNVGHVLAHETGHWLGLFHTFTGGCESPINDLVTDTPREALPTQGQYCPANRDSCPKSKGLDPIHNHMAYTADRCRTEFTPGQVAFMRFNMMLFRGVR
jgi:hypothetical protein